MISNSYIILAYLFYTFHFWNIKLQHVLNSILQSNDRAGAVSTRALEFELYNAIFKAFEDHISAIFLHSRPVSVFVIYGKEQETCNTAWWFYIFKIHKVKATFMIENTNCSEVLEFFFPFSEKMPKFNHITEYTLSKSVINIKHLRFQVA